jgi:hypothetical protein
VLTTSGLLGNTAPAITEAFGQGGFTGEGGFRAPHHCFHPSYGGCGPYAGLGGRWYGDNRGRGTYGGRRGGGWQTRGRSAPSGGHGFSGGGGQAAPSRMHQPVATVNMTTNATASGVGETIAISINLLAEAAAMLQQAFALSQTDANTTASAQTPQNLLEDSKGKDKVTIEPIKNLSKPTTFEKPEASNQMAGKQGSTGAADCNVTMYCPICDCTEHAKARCPKWRGDKPTAVTRGYAVEGLVFFQIPHTTTQHHRNDPRTTIIQVMDGALSIPNVTSELERLILVMEGRRNWQQYLQDTVP